MLEADNCLIRCEEDNLMLSAVLAYHRCTVGQCQGINVSAGDIFSAVSVVLVVTAMSTIQ